jgi:hypothetical protein
LDLKTKNKRFKNKIIFGSKVVKSLDQMKMSKIHQFFISLKAVCNPNNLEILLLNIYRTPWQSLISTLSLASRIFEVKVSLAKTVSLFNLLLQTDQNCSIGFSSGEYEGRYIHP